jgi:transposase
MLAELQAHCTKKAMPARDPASRAHHQALIRQGHQLPPGPDLQPPTEATLNNLIKWIKRIGFGFRNFESYRIRALLYAGKPNWRVLGSIVVR